MTRIWLSFCAVASLAACEATAPPAQGVGFGNYKTYPYSAQRARQAQLETPLKLSPENTGAPAVAAHGRTGPSAADLAAAGIDTSASVRVKQADRVIYGPAQDTGPVVVPAAPAQVDPAPADVDVTAANIGPANIGPVAVRQVAVARAEPQAPVGAPLSALRSGAVGNSSVAQDPQYTQSTQKLGARPASTGPDIVAYALATRHAMGTKQFQRSFASEAKARRACARYSGVDQAQRAFLEAGGPQKDRLGLDPDGDGFVCGWSPEPFRAARAG